jgi:hypothetical protein
MESTIDNDTILTTENMSSTTKYFYDVCAYIQAHSVIGDPHQSLQDWILNDDYSDKPTIASIIKKWDEDDKTYEVSDNEITKEFEAQTPEEAARLYFQGYDWAGQIPNRNARQIPPMSDSTAPDLSQTIDEGVINPTDKYYVRFCGKIVLAGYKSDMYQ